MPFLSELDRETRTRRTRAAAGLGLLSELEGFGKGRRGGPEEAETIENISEEPTPVVTPMPVVAPKPVITPMPVVALKPVITVVQPPAPVIGVTAAGTPVTIPAAASAPIQAPVSPSPSVSAGGGPVVGVTAAGTPVTIPAAAIAPKPVGFKIDWTWLSDLLNKLTGGQQHATGFKPTAQKLGLLSELEDE